MATKPMIRRLTVTALTAAAACLLQPAPSAQAAPEKPAAPGRFVRDIPGDTQPITLDADQIAAWAENGRPVTLLRGKVLVQQGAVRASFTQGVAWIEQQPAGAKRVVLYGEGQVRLDDGTARREAPTAVLELHTRGDVHFKPHRGGIAQEAPAADPLVGRAAAAIAGPAPAPAPTPAAAPPPVPHAAPPDPPVIQRTKYEEPAADPLLPGPPLPGKLTQQINPAPTPPPTLPPPAVVPTPELPPPPKATPAPRLPPVYEAPSRRFSITPRTTDSFQISAPRKEPDGRQVVVITGGAIVNVRNAPGNLGTLDIEADRVVVWSRGVNADQYLNNAAPRAPDGEVAQELEFYLQGNVEIREQSGKDVRTLRADEAYYDTNRNVAIAVNAQIDFRIPALQITEPVSFRCGELVQHAANQFEIFRADVFSSKLPSDPSLKVYVTQGTIENVVVPRVSPFGRQVINRETGLPEEDRELYFRGRDVFFEFENVPFFYSPYLAGDLLDPLGPVQSLSFGYNRIYGFQFGVTLNAYDQFGIQPYKDTRWRIDVDYLTARGPALGTDFDYAGKELCGVKANYDGLVRAYGIYDHGQDILGGGRTSNLDTPLLRGRALWRQNVFDLPHGFQVQSQISYLSDQNFLEQYFWNEFALGPNQETYLYVKQQQDFWAWTALLEPRVDRPWVTEGEKLPEARGYLLGYSLFDLFTYNTRASVGYDQLRVSNIPYPPVSVTDRYDRTGRLDWFQELSLPFDLGPFRVVPYGALDLTEYTQDLNNQEVGRVWGGGGVRGSIPFTRVYPDVKSELWNLDALNHKIVFSANYLYAKSNEPYTRFPQIDRLNDDATNQALQQIRPQYGTYNPQLGSLVDTTQIFDPQLYAIRRLVFNRIDTIDSIDVLQLDLFQRLQTKRGTPGAEHVVDWMTLDLSASYFPQAGRDNFGSPWGFLEYDYVWNAGDRTAFTSTGWVDPFDHGARVFTFGAYFNRPDRTNFFVGYRSIEPVGSRALTGAVTYIFSPKYAMTASSTYDFGTQLALSNSLVFTRIGTDLQLSFGVTYNALQNTFGVLFEIVPNIVPANKRTGPLSALGQGGVFTR